MGQSVPRFKNHNRRTRPTSGQADTKSKQRGTVGTTPTGRTDPSDWMRADLAQYRDKSPPFQPFLSHITSIGLLLHPALPRRLLVVYNRIVQISPSVGPREMLDCDGSEGMMQPQLITGPACQICTFYLPNRIKQRWYTVALVLRFGFRLPTTDKPTNILGWRGLGELPTYHE